MTSIRRLLSGISSAANWAARLEVTAPIRHQPTAPVEPVRRGFSDHSDFQSADEAQRSLLDAHAPNLAGSRRKSQDPLRVYSGLSDFQGYLPRYQHLLGINVPPPPNRYWEAARSRPAAPEAPPEQPAQEAAARPGLAPTTDLEKSLELAGEDDSVLLYAAEGAEEGRSVIQHPDGSITDPTAPDSRFADAQAWERANPELKRTLSLSRNDLELVLAMPEGPARDEVLSELAGTDGAPATYEAASDAFIPSMDDLPMALEPEPELATSEGFMPSLEDLPGEELPGSGEPVAPLLAAAEDAVPLSPEELEARFSPTGALAEGQRPLEVAELVARRGTAEMQARVATALYEQSLLPEAGEAPAYARGAALAGSASSEATQALLQRAGEARLADFVRAVMQA
ncbi:MAG: hypothetical protein JXB05_31795 [Myxococcaceae bacterium]|nr:hypothetical protein [Myxococcaceae bacterium]